MHKYRYSYLFLAIFLFSGVAIGLFWISHEWGKSDVPVVSAPVEEKPFQSVDEALKTAPAEVADHVRQLLSSQQPLPESDRNTSSAPVSLPVKTSTSQALIELSSTELRAASVTYDASEERKNTERLVDSYAPLRDPSCSLDTPANRKAMLQMMQKTAMRAESMQKTMPRPQ